MLVLCGCRDSVRVAPVQPGGTILCFGDSLTSGMGASENASYPAVLGGLIGRRTVNAGVPGETTAEGLQRLPSAIAESGASLVIICEGGNDMLRRMDDRQTSDNLRSMVRVAREKGVEVVLVAVPRLGFGIEVPSFYADIASSELVPLEKKILSSVLSQKDLKSDPIHPNTEGYRKMAEALAGFLRKHGAI